jgi:ribosome maturation factor RimP
MAPGTFGATPNAYGGRRFGAAAWTTAQRGGVAVANGPDQQQLESLLRDVTERCGVDLEEVKLAPSGRRRMLRVMVDKDHGVTLDDLADLTKEISAALDDSDVMAELSYTLEVTSPGTDRPLTEPRHWRRNSGRLVKVMALDGTEMTGRVVEADESRAVLSVDSALCDVDYAGVATAKVQVEFNRSAADPAPEAKE